MKTVESTGNVDAAARSLSAVNPGVSQKLALGRLPVEI
jgi:hypothetical protein